MRNRHLLVMVVLTVLVGGFSALSHIPRLEDPVITMRNPLVITLLPGASAERVEAQVTEKLEVALKEIPEIKEILTTSRANISVVAIELADNVTKETNQEIFARIRDKIEEARQEFPPDALAPVVDEKRGALAFTLIMGLRWQGFGEDNLMVLNREAENLADQLRTVPGTDIVRVYGSPAEQILVELDPDKAAALGMSIGEIAGALRAADAKLPAGTLVGRQRNLLVEVHGELDSLDRVADVALRSGPDGTLLRVGDVARVSRSAVEPAAQIARSDGERTLFVAARVIETQRVDQWAERASEVVETFRSNLGTGVALDTIFDQNYYTSGRLAELTANLVLGGVVVLLVVFFSMGWRASWIVGSALPLTAALTLFVVSYTGGRLHQMSIFGMIIALGLLIDNAIVVTDDIRKGLRDGLSGSAAVAQAIHHLFIPLLSSTLTTIFAFAPILLLPGNAGDFISPIANSVIIALAGSFLVAMTLVASFAGLFGKSGTFDSRLPLWLRQGVHHAPLARWFGRTLRQFYTRPGRTMLGASVIPVVGFILASTMGVQFFPRTDRNMFELQLWLPSGASINKSDTVAQAIEDRLRQREEVTAVHWLNGSSFPSVYYNLVMNKDNTPHYANAVIEATDFQAVKRLIPDIQAELDEAFPAAQIVVGQFAQGPPSEADVEFRVVGPNVSTLQNLAEVVRRKIAEHPEVLHTQVTMPRGEPKVRFNADEADARQAGLTLSDLALQLQGSLQGITAGTVLEDITELPVRVRFPTAAREDFDALQDHRFVSPSGAWVPLAAMGELELRPSSGGITRRNSERVNIVRGYTRNGALPIEVTNAVKTALDASDFTLPSGYRLEVGGDSENQSEAVGNLTLYLPVLSLLTMAILILSFRSVALAALLSVVAFLSVGFGLLATWLSGFPLSFNTILGSLGLVGLAFNSSIVVLASIRADDRARDGDPTALAERVSGSSRHLISTTLTTIGSFLPLLIFVGGEFWPPLAIVLAGGVGGSTLLAMVFTPAAYRFLQSSRSHSKSTATLSS
ncbi:MAG: efflux RND transporter permease subunit [Synoicihabitans sp.]